MRVRAMTSSNPPLTLAPGVVIKRQHLLRLTLAEQRPRPGEHWDCECLDCGGVAAKKKHHLLQLAESKNGTGCKCKQGNNDKLPAHDHTGEEVAGKRITGFAGREPASGSKAGKPLWNWVCLSCDRPGDGPARWENLQSLDRQGVCNCNHCSTRRRIEVALGTRCNNLEVIGHCRAGQHSSGSQKREVECRCVECGKEGWWQKTNFLAGKANCNCHREVVSGLSNTPEGILFMHARKRAKEQGVPFTITVHDIKIPEVCPVLCIPLGRNAGHFGDSSPSLDKLIPAKGYTPDNCWVISWRANRLKGDATPEELQALAAAVAAKVAEINGRGES